jgi:hypothetical protein
VKVEIDDLGTNTLLSLALLLFCCGACMSVDPVFRLSVPPVVDAFDFARRGQVVGGAFSIHYYVFLFLGESHIREFLLR